jgi:hypothetical protein
MTNQTPVSVRLRQARARMYRRLADLRQRLPDGLRRLKRATQSAKTRLRITLFPRLRDAWVFVIEILDEGWAAFLEIFDAVVRGTAPAYPFFFVAWIFRNIFWAWVCIAIPGIAWCVFALYVLIFPKEEACHIIVAGILDDLAEIEMLGHEASQTPHTIPENMKS